MARIISNHEMERRQLIAKAKGEMLATMQRFTEEQGLSAIEWMTVFYELQGRYLMLAQRDEFEEGP